MTHGADRIAETRRQVDRLWQRADPDTLFERLETARRLMSAAQSTSDDELVADMWRILLATLLEAEQIAEIDVALGELRAWCLNDPESACWRVLHWFGGLRAVLDGKPDEAEALLARAIPSREALGPLTVIRCFQGEFDELEALYVKVRREEPSHPSHVIMLAWLWTQQGRLTAARGAVDTLGQIDALPRDRDWLAGMCQLAELSIVFDDRPLAEKVRALLLPYAKRIVLIGDGWGCWGSVDRSLGLLARHLGRFEEAVEHFEAKIALSAAAGAHPWLARGQLDLAELLLDLDSVPDEPGDAEGERRTRPEEAVRLAREGIAAARRLDYPVLRARALELEEKLKQRGISLMMTDAVPLSSTPPTSGGGAGIAVLGSLEVIAADGTTARWSSRKARELLCILIAQRGRPVSRERLMEHLWPAESPCRLRNRLAVAISTVRRSLDPAGVLDPAHVIAATRETVRIRPERLNIDAEDFLAAAARALESRPRTEAALSEAARLYRGEAFADEPYADWAAPLRDECRTVYVAILSAIVETGPGSLRVAELARELLAIDPYDERAHRLLVGALDDLGARGSAAQARERLEALIEELDARVGD